MENVGRPFEFEVVNLEIAACQKQFAVVANQQADDITLLREPCSLPAPIAILQLDFKLA